VSSPARSTTIASSWLRRTSAAAPLEISSSRISSSISPLVVRPKRRWVFAILFASAAVNLPSGVRPMSASIQRIESGP
jgi:hypothetical protein